MSCTRNKAKTSATGDEYTHTPLELTRNPVSADVHQGKQERRVYSAYLMGRSRTRREGCVASAAAGVAKQSSLKGFDLCNEADIYAYKKIA